MRHASLIVTLALLVTGACGSTDATPETPAEPETPVVAASPQATAAPIVPVVPAVPAVPPAPPPVEPPAPATETGVLVEKGAELRFSSPSLDGHVCAEIRVLDVAPPTTTGAWPGVTCEVRLCRADGRPVGPGHVYDGTPCAENFGKPKGWTSGPGDTWTGHVPSGERIDVEFHPPKGEDLTPYGWVVCVSATPVDAKRARLHVIGGTIACIK